MTYLPNSINQVTEKYIAFVEYNSGGKFLKSYETINVQQTILSSKVSHNACMRERKESPNPLSFLRNDDLREHTKLKEPSEARYILRRLFVADFGFRVLWYVSDDEIADIWYRGSFVNQLRLKDPRPHRWERSGDVEDPSWCTGPPAAAPEPRNRASGSSAVETPLTVLINFWRSRRSWAPWVWHKTYIYILPIYWRF